MSGLYIYINIKQEKIEQTKLIKHSWTSYSNALLSITCVKLCSGHNTTHSLFAICLIVISAGVQATAPGDASGFSHSCDLPVDLINQHLTSTTYNEWKILKNVKYRKVYSWTVTNMTFFHNLTIIALKVWLFTRTLHNNCTSGA